MPPLPPVTIATLPVKSKSGAMLRPPVLTLLAVTPTIPHRYGSSPPVICAQAGQVSTHPAKLVGQLQCAALCRREGMAYEYILVEREQGVAILTMNRPDKLNAMNRQLSGELHDAVKQMEADEEVGCIVIMGAGNRAFSAGGDIHEQRENDVLYTKEELDTRGAVRSRGSYEISACAKPTIGMMNGLAYGGAAVLASSLDMRVGCEHSRFCFLAAAYGPINSTWTLPNQVGWPIAKELLFSARVVEAEEAYRIGLLNHLVPCAQLREKTMELATMIVNNRRDAVMGVKALLLQHMGHNLEEQWAAERDYTTHVVRGARAEEAFPEFIARKGRPLPSGNA